MANVYVMWYIFAPDSVSGKVHSSWHYLMLETRMV